MIGVEGITEPIATESTSNSSISVNTSILRMEPALNEALALSEALTLVVEEPDANRNTVAFLSYELRYRTILLANKYNLLLDLLANPDRITVHDCAH